MPPSGTRKRCARSDPAWNGLSLKAAERAWKCCASKRCCPRWKASARRPRPACRRRSGNSPYSPACRRRRRAPIGWKRFAQSAALIARARDHNPAVAAARRGVESAEAGERVAIAAWIPRFDAVGAYLGYGSLDSDFTLEWQVGVSLSYPLFTGGARSGATKEASARTRAAREDLRMSELSAEESIDRALAVVVETGALADAAGRGLTHQEEVVRIEALSRDVGTGTQTDYLEAEAQLFRVRSRLIESRNAEIAARVELARILGDLTPEWLIQHLETTR
jgi:outer membrane protein TolC